MASATGVTALPRVNIRPTRPATRYDTSRRNSHFGRFASSRQHNRLCDKMFQSPRREASEEDFPTAKSGRFLL